MTGLAEEQKRRRVGNPEQLGALLLAQWSFQVNDPLNAVDLAVAGFTLRASCGMNPVVL